MKTETCLINTCDLSLDKTYWDNQYLANTLGWDLGQVSPPIKEYIDSIPNKNAKILIPGCGNSYEAEYLLKNNFTDITVIDISPTLVAALKQKFAENKNIKIVLGDFFEHKNQYDIIIEQTFFCALHPNDREKYVFKMHELLRKNGKLVGLLFNREFEKSPPFGGSLKEYEMLFANSFILNSISPAINSVTPRTNSELFIDFTKNSEAVVQLFQLQGITSTNYQKIVASKLSATLGVFNVSTNANFSQILITSNSKINIEILQSALSYDEKYTISEINKIL
jgi:SAM-dependent methyltransferase